jgi:hypothetical protein
MSEPIDHRVRWYIGLFRPPRGRQLSCASVYGHDYAISMLGHRMIQKIDVSIGGGPEHDFRRAGLESVADRANAA